METYRGECTEGRGALRFGQWRRHAPETSRKVLTAQLPELEGDQVISRKAFGQRWERVEYDLTA
jgi:DNA-binding HxlR family transcriptional regulator